MTIVELVERLQASCETYGNETPVKFVTIDGEAELLSEYEHKGTIYIDIGTEKDCAERNKCLG